LSSWWESNPGPTFLPHEVGAALSEQGAIGWNDFFEVSFSKPYNPEEHEKFRENLLATE
jgi:hypothetical protein